MLKHVYELLDQINSVMKALSAKVYIQGNVFSALTFRPDCELID